MAILLSSSASASIFTSPQSQSLKPSLPFLISTVNPHRKPSGRSKRFSPLRVATQPQTTDPGQPTKTEQDGESYNLENEVEDESSGTKFNWRDHWYPVSLIEDLDPKLPTPFQLLGRDIVLWFDRNKQEWVALDDKCPHRLAPLSVSFLLHSVGFRV